MISAHFNVPYFLQQGLAVKNTFTAYHGSSEDIEKIDVGTWAIKNSSDTTLTSGSLDILVNGSAEFEITTSLPIGEYYIQFDFTTEGHGSHDAESFSARNELFICKAIFKPTVIPSDIYAKAPSLNPASASTVSSYTSDDFATFIDTCWNDITNELISMGKRPQMIISPTQLKVWHIAKVLALVYEDFGSRNNEIYLQLSDKWKAEAKKAKESLSIKYEGDVSGRRRKITNTLWMM